MSYSGSFSPEIMTDPEMIYDVYVAMTATLALAGFGIEVSEQTRQNWNQALKLIHFVDDVVDSGDKEATELTIETVGRILEVDKAKINVSDSVVHALGKAGIDAAWYLRDKLSAEQAANFMRCGRGIIDMRAMMETETDVRNYAAYTRREAELTAMMVGSVMQAEEQAHPNYPKLIRFLRAGGGTYNLLDSIFDLEADYRTGLTAIEPTPANHLRMVPPALESVDGQWRVIAKLAAKPNVWKSFALPVYTLFKDRFRGNAKTIDSGHAISGRL